MEHPLGEWVTRNPRKAGETRNSISPFCHLSTSLPEIHVARLHSNVNHVEPFPNRSV